jgi:S1-C subfamily serine protease
LHKAPAQAITSEAAPAPAQEASSDVDSPARSPKDVFNEVSASIVRVDVKDGSARLIDSVSGIVVAPGMVITNCHVVVSGTTLAVKGRGEPRPATVQMADEQLNLCRLSVPGLDAPPATLGSVWSLHQGQRVLAVGAPLSGEASMRDGTVSALAQVDHGTVIHTTAPISAAWSGGGLFDFAGHLVGIATYHHPYGQNINVALPVDWIAQMQARAADTNVPQARTLAADQDISADLIAGRWVCFGSIPGRNGDYTFRDDGRVLVTSSQGTPIDARYSVSKRALQFGSAAQRITFNIESFSQARMIWQLGGAESRVVCNRR